MKSLSEQASKISILLVVTITIGKFIAYIFSNSLTVYSEAWHGFSDLFTTLLIFVAIKISNRKRDSDNKDNALLHPLEKEKSKKAEIFVAILIGVILSYISISIMYNVIFYKELNIKYPLVTGITFIIFSFTSYFLYKFQTKVGKLDNSVALIADGQHSRSDMVTSLITGFSLILYSRGIDVDRYSAGLLSIVIFTFAIELIITTIKSIKGNESLTSNLFSKKNKLPKKYIFSSGIILLFIVLSYNIFVEIPIGSQGVLLRFGKQVKILNSGKHLVFPYPIDKTISIDVKRVKTINIGNIANGPLIWSKKHGTDTREMITGDNNFIVPYIKIDYNIKNITKYYLSYKDVPRVISDITNQILTAYISSSSFKEILLKRVWVDKIKKDIQLKLDSLNTGINIINFTIQDIHPPKDVSLAFENLIATQQELLTLKNRAESYSTLKVMNAKTESFRVISMAQTDGYKKLMEITGKNIKDSQMADIFNKYSEVVKRYLYLDMISKTIVNNKKILIDNNSNIELRFENKDKK
jgi:membrane protease subunit HflK